MPTPLPLALYNPALLPAEALLAEFTARLPMLATLLDIIRHNAPGQPPQHILLVGPRGMGKTTTLWAIAHSVDRDTDLSRQWQPVVFDEESRRVGDLADFWLEAIRQWEHAVQDPTDRSGRLLDDAGPDIEERARRTFLEAVDRSGRRALLLVDNLNDLFASINDPEPLHHLRAFLMEDSRVMIVGGAARYFDEITHIDRPFYDFFRVFELRVLSLEEMKDCLLALAQSRGDESVKRTIRERSGTLQALHLLTGGNPRLIKTFYRLLAEGLRGDIRADLERLLDEFTPYFKGIVDALPVQQQRILDAVALTWDPVEVAAIARVTRVPSNQVSAQLRALVKAGLVSEAAGHPKRKSYLLADRFSNIHYLMRHGRAARCRFDWFILLLGALFPDDDQPEVLARVVRLTLAAGAPGLEDTRDLLRSALDHADSDESRRRILHATLRETWDKDTLKSLSHWLDVESARRHFPEVEILAFFREMPPELRKNLGYQPEDAGWWFRLTDFLEQKQAWPLAEAAYRKAIELGPKAAFPWIFLGHLLRDHLDRFAEAEAAYRKAIELDPKDASPWYSLGILMQDKPARFAEAETAYRKAIELDPKGDWPWIWLGKLQVQFGRFTEAEAAYRKAIELGPKRAFPWILLGHLLRDHLERFAEAEAAYRKAIELNPKDDWPWYSLGILMQDKLSRFAEAETAYRKAIELNPKYAYPWSGLADVLAKHGGREAEARACAVMALPLKPDSDFARYVFLRLCAQHADDWQAVLPSLAKWCAVNPQAKQVFEFTVDGFLRLARLASPAEALALLDALPDPSPFELLRDAFRAHADRDHLHRLAPERRTLALELLKRLSDANRSRD